MSRSTDAGNFFQTTAALDENARKAQKAKNKSGNPIQLASKILALAADSENADIVFAAEAAGTVKRVALETAEITHTFRPNTSALAPLTCLAISSSQKQRKLYAGSWDKNVYSWTLPGSSSSTVTASTKFAGHADFVKALLSFNLGGEELLISASADATIIVWDAGSGKKLHTLKGHSRGVQALSLESVSGSAESAHATIFSGDSNREIRRWRISVSSAFEILATGTSDETTTTSPGAVDPLIAHETSIYALRFDSDGDLWTASADKTVKCLSRDRAWAADTTLPHPDFVRDVVVSDETGHIVTACRDEEIRVWDRGSGRLFHTFSGHFEEVTGLVLVGSTAVSVSIDRTIRRWSLKPEDLKRAKEEALKGEDKEEEKPKENLLTEDEDRELAELMDDSD